jgi:hypothetical protein
MVEVRKKPDKYPALSDDLKAYFLFTEAAAGDFNAATDAVVFFQLRLTCLSWHAAAGI